MTLEVPTLVGREVTLRPLVLDDVDALVAAAAESREHYGLSTVPDGPDATRAWGVAPAGPGRRRRAGGGGGRVARARWAQHRARRSRRDAGVGRALLETARRW